MRYCWKHGTAGDTRADGGSDGPDCGLVEERRVHNGRRLPHLRDGVAGVVDRRILVSTLLVLSQQQLRLRWRPTRAAHMSILHLFLQHRHQCGTIHTLATNLSTKCCVCPFYPSPSPRKKDYAKTKKRTKNGASAVEKGGKTPKEWGSNITKGDKNCLSIGDAELPMPLGTGAPVVVSSRLVQCGS